MIGEVLTGLNILEKLGKFLAWLKHAKATPTDSIVARFVRLHESHGVHRNQIPRFAGHGLTLKDVQDDAALLSRLNEPLLEAACTRFAVRREWLDGAESQVYPCHDFYKYPQDFADFIDKLRADYPEGNLHGLLIAPSDQSWKAEALLILQETICFVGDKPIFRYHLCNNWLFAYWKARAYITACVALAWRRGVFIHGTYLPAKKIKAFAAGETLFDLPGEGIWGFGRKKWHTEDLALLPDAFLKGVDPEQDDYGINAGLALWLELDDQGFMATGLDKEARPLFQAALDRARQARLVV